MIIIQGLHSFSTELVVATIKRHSMHLWSHLISPACSFGRVACPPRTVTELSTLALEQAPPAVLYLACHCCCCLQALNGHRTFRPSRSYKQKMQPSNSPATACLFTTNGHGAINSSAQTSSSTCSHRIHLLQLTPRKLGDGHQAFSHPLAQTAATPTTWHIHLLATLFRQILVISLGATVVAGTTFVHPTFVLD